MNNTVHTSYATLTGKGIEVVISPSTGELVMKFFNGSMIYEHTNVSSLAPDLCEETLILEERKAA